MSPAASNFQLKSGLTLRTSAQPCRKVDVLRCAGLGVNQSRDPHYPKRSQLRVAITPRPDPKLIGALLQSSGEMRAMLPLRVWAASQVAPAPSRPDETGTARKGNAKNKCQRERNKNKKYKAYATEGCTHCKPLRYAKVFLRTI
jgi:hypothetical protein